MSQEVGVLGTLKEVKDNEEAEAEVEQITERDKTAAEIFVTDILTEAYKKEQVIFILNHLGSRKD